MVDAREFMEREIEVALGDFVEDYDVQAIFDELRDDGSIEFDAHGGFKWAVDERDMDDEWREHMYEVAARHDRTAQ